MKQPNIFKPTFEIKRGSHNIPQTTTEIKIRSGEDKTSVFKDVELLIDAEIKAIFAIKPS